MTPLHPAGQSDDIRAKDYLTLIVKSNEMSTEKHFTLTIGGRRFAASHDAIAALLESMELTPVPEPEPEPEPEPVPEPKAPKAVSSRVAARISRARAVLERTEVVAETAAAPKTTCTWKERVAQMDGPPKRCDYASKKEWNLAYVMFKYHTKPEERERVNTGVIVRRLLKRAEDISAGKAHARPGRPPKVFPIAADE